MAPASPAGTTTVLPRTSRHFARRFSGGITPKLAAEISRAGGGRRWFAQQLSPGSITDTYATEIGTWFPSLGRTPEQIFNRQRDDVEGSWEVMWDLSRWTVARRVHSKRQVLEQMVDFWSNLLHVPLGADSAAFHRVEYDKVIRRHALGRFDEMLFEAITHPAMGLYLNNATSTKDAPNENLGRELLELHTVGVGNHTESDVKNSAKILTGWRSDVWWPKFQTFYDSRTHWTGPVRVLDFTHANSDPDGRAVTAAYLRYLAHHPDTSRRIARKLCVRFVRDDPSDALVNAVAKAFRDHDTAIKPTLLALVDHPDFLASAGAKVRTPTDDYVASIRALGIKILKPTSGESFVNAMYWQYRDAGQAPYEWSAPDGYPHTNAAWSSTGRVLSSLDFHRNLAAQWWPRQQATFRSNASLLPRLPATLETVIDHVAVKVVGQPPPAHIARGIAIALGMSLTTKVTSATAGNYWLLRTITASLLDSPLHLHR